MPEIERLHPTAANLPFRPVADCHQVPKQTFAEANRAAFPTSAVAASMA